MRSIFLMAVLTLPLVFAGCSRSPETTETPKTPKGPESNIRDTSKAPDSAKLQDTDKPQSPGKVSRVNAPEAEEDKAGLGEAGARTNRIGQARQARGRRWEME